MAHAQNGHRADAGAAAAAACSPPRALVKYVKLKYFHYTLWTGLYMLDAHEVYIINAVNCLLFGYILRWCVRSGGWLLAAL
ncbi:hypothetical protein M885DRAFT_550575, partial [Pelagophyceae sp. CCMP2097]